MHSSGLSDCPHTGGQAGPAHSLPAPSTPLLVSALPPPRRGPVDHALATGRSDPLQPGMRPHRHIDARARGTLLLQDPVLVQGLHATGPEGETGKPSENQSITYHMPRPTCLLAIEMRGCDLLKPAEPHLPWLHDQGRAALQRQLHILLGCWRRAGICGSSNGIVPA